LLLADALRRIGPDPQVLDLRVFGAADPLPLFVRRLCELVASGQYTLKGRRGSPTMALEDIPADAIPYFDFGRAAHSEIQERRQEPMGPAGPRWFGVRVYMRAPAIDLPANDAGVLARRLYADYPRRPLDNVESLVDKYYVSKRTMERALALLSKFPGWD
jgi:hypothetical protein